MTESIHKSQTTGHRTWFPAKRYGWGWGPPVAWQGWVVIVVWAGLVLAIGPLLAPRSWAAFAVFIMLIVGLLIGVCYARGERPKWRWGGPGADRPGD